MPPPIRKIPKRIAKKIKQSETIKAQEAALSEPLIAQVIDVHNRDLTEIDSWIRFSNITPNSTYENTNKIIASKNKLQLLPSLHEFINLELLNVSRNCIVSLEGSQLGFLQNLKHLDLSWNNLTVFPNEICHLISLELLVIHHNQLESFPIEINLLKTLRKLDASYNNIDTVKDTLERLPLLEELNLTGNPEIVDMFPRARRLCEKQALLTSKTERRQLIQRALGVRKGVLNMEQKEIFDAIESSKKNNFFEINEYP